MQLPIPDIHLLEFKYVSVKLGEKNPESKFSPEKCKGSETTSFLLLLWLMLVLSSVELKVSGHICWWTFYKGFCAVLVNVE